MTFKHTLAKWLQCFPPLRWGLQLAVSLFAPRHHVGATGVVFNNAGQILLVEHVFRPNYNWGLPGGWVERGENPADTVRRELEEELGLQVEVKRLLLCEVQNIEPNGSTPLSLGLAYYCRLVNETAPDNSPPLHGYEVLSMAWINPTAIPWVLPALAQKAIALAQVEFEQERSLDNANP